MTTQVHELNDLFNKKTAGLLTVTLLAFLQFSAYSQISEVVKIWDKAPHNAFTDLIRYKSYFFCTFREGNSHVPKDTTQNGRIRILRSADCRKWESVALLASRRFDLRDSKLSVTPGGKLMVLMGGSHYVNGNLADMMPHVSFSSDGSEFTEPVPVLIEPSIRTSFDWIWRVTWNGDTGYGVVYQSRTAENNNKIRLLVTKDGIAYRQVIPFDIGSMPNEATIRFDGNDKMMILLRRENGANGMLGISRPPYREWQWNELSYRLGGPDFLILKNGKLLIGTRLYKPGSASTVVYVADVKGVVRKMSELPSGGDTSYPGLLVFKNRLWISYYSSHEGKASVYLAKIRLRDLLKE